jgi:hypothetical protein
MQELSHFKSPSDHDEEASDHDEEASDHDEEASDYDEEAVTTKGELLFFPGESNMHKSMFCILSMVVLVDNYLITHCITIY